MKNLMNSAAIGFFSMYAKMKGYRFSVVNTEAENADSDKIFNEGGYKLPESFRQEMEVYKTDAIKFIAYYKNKAVGTVGLADPGIRNRPYELHGIDQNGEHFEIQSLVVSKEHRECTQLVLLGLFKEMYAWSLRNSVKSWISFGLRQLYITMRRYNKNICLVGLNENNYRLPLAHYLYENNVFDTCSIMKVEDFTPSRICAKFLKKRLKKIGLFNNR